MNSFRDWSIRRKLTSLFVAMACFTAMTILLLVGVFDLLGLRQAMARDLGTVADILARNSTASLMFRDRDAAHDVLQALNAEPSITAACIYTEDGKPFAKYVRRRSEHDFVPPPVQERITRFERQRLILFRDIVLDNERVGTIYLESDLQRLNKRLREYSIAFLISLSLTLTLALPVASRLQRPISRPLLELVKTAETVSLAGNYSVRATLPNRDEFGALVSAFNGMLEQIENRDQRLLRHREQLEKEVASRTAALLAANVNLQRAEEKYRAIFEDAVVGIFQITPNGRPLSINRALAHMHGFESPEQLMAEVSDVASELFVDPSRMRELQRATFENGIVRSAEVQVYRRDRTKKWVLANMRSVKDAQGAIVFLEGTVEDITDRKLAEERVQFLAYYDALTGLPNRTLFRDRVAGSLAGALRRHEKVALLFLDLDRFKVINDSLGHSVGDLLLEEVAERLKKWARAQDTVARIGGDEFLVLLNGVRDASDAARAAERLMDAITAEFKVRGHSFAPSCSIGISIFPEHGTDDETLIKNADAAMYCAKESGRNAFRFFTEEMNAELLERLTLERDLRFALERKEFFLMYQPQFELDSGRLVGFEALLRWKHPSAGLIPPDKFIRVAESSGLIVPIGEWVLSTACSAAQDWRQRFGCHVTVAVNISAVQLHYEGFYTTVDRALQDSGLPAEDLELEITESVLIANSELTLPVLNRIKARGVKLALDDFGTGYSSLSYLRQFPVDRLKIDRSFISAIQRKADDNAITGAIISMCKSLGLKVIAEGVETEAQIAFLRARQCDEVQGYYYGRPVVATEVVRIMKENSVAISTSRTMLASSAPTLPLVH